MSQTQNKLILDLLLSGEVLTGLDALSRVGTMKLATRIGEIKEELRGKQSSIIIRDGWIHAPNGKKYKKYWIESPVV